MALTTMYFLRHGEIDNPQQVFYGRSLNLPLNIEGERQARSIAEVLKATTPSVDRIYTSPLVRAVSTAETIKAKYPSATLTVEDDFTDVFIPVLVNTPIARRSEIHERDEDEYSGTYAEQGNESREEIVERMMRAFRKIHKENSGKTVVIVSHGDPLRFLLFRLQNREAALPLIEELISSYYPDKGEGFRLLIDEQERIRETSFVTREDTVKLKREIQQ